MITTCTTMLVEDNIRLAKKVANRFALQCTIEFDDLFQISSIGLFKAAKGFDPDKGIQFSTYAWRIMSNEIASALGKDSKRVDCNAESIEERSEVDNVQYVDTNPLPEEIVLSNDTVKHIRDILEPEEFELLWLRSVEEIPQKEVARIMGMSQAHVSRIERKVKAKVKDLVEY